MRLFLLLALNTFILLKNLDVCFANEACKVDRQALLEFKSQVSESKREVLASWNHSTPLCQWVGVTCGRKHKRVTSLNLGGFELGGIISPSIGNISFLRSLNLGYNTFGGTIPKEVGKLFRLQELNMSYNTLEGVIPTSLSNCSRLVILNLMSNRLVHGLPPELGLLSSLRMLVLSINNISGKLPVSLGNVSSLNVLSISYNHIEGEVPETIGRLTHLKFLDLMQNNLSGIFPPPIYNLSSLRVLSIVANNFSGSLRPKFGNILATLKEMYLGENSFSGGLPRTISNISNLEQLDLPENHFTGKIPVSIGKLRNLQRLAFHKNSFGNNLPGDLEFLSALENCTQLQVLSASYNRFGGYFPITVANLSNKLTRLYLGGNLIIGSIPHDIGNLINLQSLGLEKNFLTGRIPTSLGKLSELKNLLLHTNKLSGEIPTILGNISRLENLYLYNNSFEGNIPPSLGNCGFLLDLWIGSNRLNGTLPQDIMQIESLVGLEISKNVLTGHFPKDIGRLKFLVELYAGKNRFHGNIPETIGNCLSVEVIDLGGNGFNGTIPDIRNLRGLKYVDLSNNSLWGSIPEYFENFSSLNHLNLSLNSLEGMVPTKGVFSNAEIFSVNGNKELCGGISELKLKPCPLSVMSRKGSNSSNKKKIFIGVGIGVGSLLLSLLALSLLYMIMKRKKKINNAHNTSTLLLTSPLEAFYERVSYEELRTASCDFSPKSFIGSGNFGSVFKGFLGSESTAIAIKVLDLEKSGAEKSFIAECEALKGIRHRNLVKLLTTCSSIDFKGNEFRALVYKFMPNGNLETWLHPMEIGGGGSGNISRPLKLCERLNIAIDVASVLDYIHSQCHDPVAHCDLKPSNVLLDDDLTAHVSDFGLARILFKVDHESFINQFSSAGVRGTIGYAAPEYGIGSRPSKEGDIYSFGVLILEMFTGKRPTDQLFVEDFTLRSYIESGLPEHVLDIADISIIREEARNRSITTIAECLKTVFHAGLRCCEESPANRMTMAEALAELVSLKDKFFKTKRRRM